MIKWFLLSLLVIIILAAIIFFFAIFNFIKDLKSNPVGNIVSFTKNGQKAMGVIVEDHNDHFKVKYKIGKKGITRWEYVNKKQCKLVFWNSSGVDL